MKWADQLYVSERACKRKDKIIKKANVNAGLTNVFFVTLSTNPLDLLDIFEATYLKQPSFYKQDLRVVGIATTKGEALDLVVDMISDIYEKTGDVKVREYFTFPPEDSRNQKRIRRSIWGK